MKTKTPKTFDCVEMKRQGAERVMARLKGMTQEEILEYWRKRTAEMRESQRQIRPSR